MPSRAQTNRWFPPPSFYADEKCTRCGVCCGSTDGDPCVHLCEDGEGRFFCEVYSVRFGPRYTLLGHPFHCVVIRKVIEYGGGYDCCAYVQEIRRIREQRGEPTDDLGRMANPLG